MTNEPAIGIDDLRRRLETSGTGVESWLYLAPSADRTAGNLPRDEAVLVALAVRLRQCGLTTTATRRLLADVLTLTQGRSSCDWIVVKQPRRRATVHSREPIDLTAMRLDASVHVFTSAELRQLLSD